MCPRFSAFNSTHFTSKPSYEERIYAEMVKSLGSGKNYSIEFDSLVAARLYANAMAFGRCKYAIERLGQQFRPSRALENLPLLEREYGLVPEPKASIAQRRAEVVVAARVARGARRSNVEAILRDMFGDDFLEYVTTPIADAIVSPADPTETGVYERPGSPRAAFALLVPVARIGTPITVGLRRLAGTSAALRVGARVTVDSGDYGRTEAVEVTAVATAGEQINLTATFTKPHNRGVVLATGRHASQYTSKRHNLFVLSAAAARDAHARRRLHRVARRLLRAISGWSVVDTSGPFRIGQGQLGITTVGALP